MTHIFSHDVIIKISLLFIFKMLSDKFDEKGRIHNILSKINFDNVQKMQSHDTDFNFTAYNCI